MNYFYSNRTNTVFIFIEAL